MLLLVIYSIISKHVRKSNSTRKIHPPITRPILYGSLQSYCQESYLRQRQKWLRHSQRQTNLSNLICRFTGGTTSLRRSRPSIQTDYSRRWNDQQSLCEDRPRRAKRHLPSSQNGSCTQWRHPLLQDDTLQNMCHVAYQLWNQKSRL
jgi:hypothetical protein